MANKRTKLLLILPLAIAVSTALFFHAPADEVKEYISRVARVIDGDTILLENGEKVRLIGVDTPEKLHPSKPVQYYAEEASAFTKRMAEGKKVKLEFDWQKRDKYNRLLAYVYVLDGNIFLNAEIVREGYGFAYTRFPFKYLDEFREYEKRAREGQEGLWNGGPVVELRWLQKEGRKPFNIFDTANNQWGVEYDGFFKGRLSDSLLLEEMINLRLWAYELSPRDLEEKLLNAGWQKEGGQDE